MTATSSRAPLLAAGLFGLTGIVFGAFGAHALKATLIERGMTAVWESAVKYHLLHAVALLALAAWARSDANGTSNRLATWVTRSWIGGLMLFSGSLYWLALGGPRWLGPVTPLGGVAFMVGWLLLAVAALRQKG